MSAVDKQQVLFRLNVDLQEMGIQYLGDDPQTAGDILKHLRARVGDKPACYLRSFDPHDPPCRKCDLWGSCSQGVVHARVDLTEAPQEIVACRVCDGDLMVELFDDHGHIQDLACTTPGCSQTLNRQKKDAADGK